MEKDLTTGKPTKVLWLFCLPLFASVLFQQAYVLADSLIAGKALGELSLAAVGNGYEITLLFLAFAFGCNIACSVLVSRYFGSKKIGRVKTVVSTAMVASGILCLFLMGIGIFFCDDLLRLIRTPMEVFDDSKVYLDIYVWGLPFIFFYNIGTGVFSGLGDSKTPFLFLAFSSAANIGMDLLFVLVLNLGVAGVAWATFLCQGVSCLLCLSVLFFRLFRLKTEEKGVFFSAAELGELAKIAVPSILQQSFISVGNILIQGAINGFGAGVMAGYSASIKLNNLVINAFFTIGNGVSNFTAQNLGAKKPERVKQGFKAGVKLVLILSVPLIALYCGAGRYLVMLFLDHPSEEALSSGMMILWILSPFYPVVAVKLVADGVLRGGGFMGRFMVATFTDLLLRVAMAFALSSTPLGSTGIWMAWPIGWGVASLISLVLYSRLPLQGRAEQIEQ